MKGFTLLWAFRHYSILLCYVILIRNYFISQGYFTLQASFVKISTYKIEAFETNVSDFFCAELSTNFEINMFISSWTHIPDVFLRFLPVYYRLIIDYLSK